MYVLLSPAIPAFKLTRSWLLIITCILTYKCSAQPKRQKTPANISIGIQQYFGSFLATAPKASFIRDSYSSFTELAVSQQTRGNKEWHQYNNYPEVGVGAIYGNLGSRQYLGKSFSVFPFVRFPLLQNNQFKLKFRAGTGFTWIEKPYDVVSNHKNTLIGSHLNHYIHLSVENELRLGKTVSLNAGLAFIHMSNAGAQLPNFGLNFPMVTGGFRYSFNEKIVRDTTVISPASRKQIRILLSAGRKQTPWVSSPHYTVGILGAEIGKLISPAQLVGGGLAVFHDPSLTKDPTGYTLTKNKSKNIQVGLQLLYERKLGRLSIPLQVGYYLLHPAKRGNLYQNVGLRYQLSKNLSAFYTLKVHAGKADYLHTGLAYTFFYQ